MTHARVRRALEATAEYGAVQSPDGRGSSSVNSSYRLSLQLLLTGEHVRNQNILYQIAKSGLDTLTVETDEFAHLTTEQHGLSVNLHEVSGDTAVGDSYQVSKRQRTDSLHVSPTGKAVLAHLPPERIDLLVGQYVLPREDGRDDHRPRRAVRGA